MRRWRISSPRAALRLRAALGVVALATLAAAAAALAVEGSCTLKIRYVPARDSGETAFRGVLESSKQVCVPRRLVRVKRVRRGADERVGSDLTDVRGRWNVERAPNQVHPGRYYAKTRRRVVGEVTCLGARTPAVRVRR